MPCEVLILSARADDYAEAIEVFKGAGESSSFFKKSYGYALFPTIGKAWDSVTREDRAAAFQAWWGEGSGRPPTSVIPSESYLGRAGSYSMRRACTTSRSRYSPKREPGAYTMRPPQVMRVIHSSSGGRALGQMTSPIGIVASEYRTLVMTSYLY